MELVTYRSPEERARLRAERAAFKKTGERKRRRQALEAARLPAVPKPPNRRRHWKPSERRRIREVLARLYGWKCWWCKRPLTPKPDLGPQGRVPLDFPTIEHLIRLADGGTDDFANLRLACRTCNNGRHTPDERE